MDKGVGKHQKVRPVAAKTEIRDYTALELVGDARRAEALVIEAIESLNPENVAGEALRDAVVEVLVRAQMMSSKHPSHVL